MIRQGASPINTGYFDSVVSAIDAAPTCEDLQAVISRALPSIDGLQAAMNQQVAALQPLVALLTAPSANPGAIVGWIQGLVNNYLTPSVKPITALTQQLVQMQAQLARINAAIAAKQSQLTSCGLAVPSVSISVPSIPDATLAAIAAAVAIADEAAANGGYTGGGNNNGGGAGGGGSIPPSGGSGQSDLYSMTSGSQSSAAPFGTPVCLSAGDVFDLAEATSVVKGTVIGLVASDQIAAGATGLIKQGGVLTGTAAQWSSVTGDASGLVADARYFLSDTPGRMSRVPPKNNAYGHVNTLLGIALSSTELKLLLRDPILL